MAKARRANGGAEAGSRKDNGASLGFEAKLWAAADALRNNMDAAEYKHVVLGLIFLKYISDAGAINKTLEAMAGALFKSWFRDFDPVRARIDRRITGVPDALTDLFPSGFEGSALGEIPKGWKAGSVYDIADVVYGAPFASTQFNLERRGYPLVRIRDLVDETPEVWTDEIHPKGYKIRAGEIVVGMDGEFRAYLWGGNEAWLNQRVCAFVPKEGISPAFVRNSIIRPLADVEASETGTTVIHLGKNDIDRFLIVTPTQEVLTEFNRLCQPMYDRIVVGKQEARILAAIRDTLLPKLISGELRVKEAERLVKAAL